MMKTSANLIGSHMFAVTVASVISGTKFSVWVVVVTLVLAVPFLVNRPRETGLFVTTYRPAVVVTRLLTTTKNMIPPSTPVIPLSNIVVRLTEEFLLVPLPTVNIRRKTTFATRVTFLRPSAIAAFETARILSLPS